MEINWETPLDDSTDYVEYFLKEMCRRADDPENTFTFVSDFCFFFCFRYPQLENMCLDLWVAGMETTSNTLTWGVLFALHNPDAQVSVKFAYFVCRKSCTPNWTRKSAATASLTTPIATSFTT